ncbi:hypothetical protein HPB47_023179, partial [Ixodes persulcatus]
ASVFVCGVLAPSRLGEPGKGCPFDSSVESPPCLVCDCHRNEVDDATPGVFTNVAASGLCQRGLRGPRGLRPAAVPVRLRDAGRVREPAVPARAGRRQRRQDRLVRLPGRVRPVPAGAVRRGLGRLPGLGEDQRAGDPGLGARRRQDRVPAAAPFGARRSAHGRTLRRRGASKGRPPVPGLLVREEGARPPLPVSGRSGHSPTRVHPEGLLTP